MSKGAGNHGADGQSRSGHDDEIAQTHLQVGWWSLLVFLTLGIALETLHGFKVGFYLDVSNGTRRLMWTLAHTHGTLISILNVLFAHSLGDMGGWGRSSLRVTSWCLRGALLLMPLGFFLGGLGIRGGDPGLGALLVPPGAALLFVAVLHTARASTRRSE